MDPDTDFTQNLKASGLATVRVTVAGVRRVLRALMSLAPTPSYPPPA